MHQDKYAYITFLVTQDLGFFPFTTDKIRHLSELTWILLLGQMIIFEIMLHLTLSILPYSKQKGKKKRSICSCLHVSICLKIIKIASNKRLQDFFCILTKVCLSFIFLHLYEQSPFDLGVIQCDKIATSHVKLSQQFQIINYFVKHV